MEYALHQAKVFVAIDGDDVGTALRQRIIENRIEDASILSKAITEYFGIIASVLEGKGFHIIFCGGDSLLATGNRKLTVLSWSTDIPKGPCTISVGIGHTPEQAYLALQLAKARGKNQVVTIENAIGKTIFKWKN